MKLLQPIGYPQQNLILAVDPVTGRTVAVAQTELTDSSGAAMAPPHLETAGLSLPTTTLEVATGFSDLWGTPAIAANPLATVVLYGEQDGSGEPTGNERVAILDPSGSLVQALELDSDLGSTSVDVLHVQAAPLGNDFVIAWTRYGDPQPLFVRRLVCTP
jgi:hypothetical protein